MNQNNTSKKNNKPLIEKKRRARINECLSQLKLLVLQAMRKETGNYTKLEKADILEMTVKYLKQQKRQQVLDSNSINKYLAGYNECASEVQRYLSSSDIIDMDTRSRLINHLFNKANNYSEKIHPSFVYNLVSGVLPSGQLTALLVPVQNQTSKAKVDTATSTSDEDEEMEEYETDHEKENIPWRPW